jgi:hypothetical protein
MDVPMITIPTSAFLIGLHLAAGSFLLLPIAPIRELGLGFFRTMATIATLILGAALYLVPLHVTAGAHPEFGRFDTEPLQVAYGLGSVSVFGLLFVLMLLYTAAIWAGRLTAAALLLIGSAVCSLVAIGVSAGPFAAAMPDTFSRLLLPVSFYVSAVFQAAGLVGMILGHQYLMPVRLPFRPFEILSGIFFGACVAQSLLVGLSLVHALSGTHGALLGSMLAMDHPLGLFLWIRLAVGLVLVAVVAAMTVHCVRLRANMAATGLLYIGMSMAIGGEIFARILLLTTSILM